MLSNEGRMPAHGRLLAIIGGSSRRQALGDEVGGMIQDSWDAPVLEIGLLLRSEPEAGPEGRSGEPWKHLFQRAHQRFSPSAASSASSNRSITFARVATFGSSRRAKFWSL